MLLIPNQDDIDVEIINFLLPETLSYQQRNEEDVQRQIFPILTVTRDDEEGEEEEEEEDDTDCEDKREKNYDNDVTKHLQIQRTLLLRPTEERPGLVAWHLPLSTIIKINSTKKRDPNNRRATCLAMTCGLFQCRFYGNVMVDVFQTTYSATSTTTITASTLELLQALKHVALEGAMYSPDDRLWKESDINLDQLSVTTKVVRSWILQAAKENYHDQETVQRWAQITSRRQKSQNTYSSSSSSSGSDDDDDTNDNNEDDGQDVELNEETIQQNIGVQHEFVTEKPLCLQCRRPTSRLCEGCQGAYFCPAPRMCRQEG